MNLAILPLSCSDVPRVTVTSRQQMDMVARRGRDFFLQESGAREWLDVQVFDWVELPITLDQWLDYGVLAGDHVVPMVEQKLGISLARFAHFALIIDVPGHRSGAFFPAYNLKYGHMAAQDLNPALLEHEVGHLYAAGHANLDTPGGVLEYGDAFCIMGMEGGKYSFLAPADFKFEPEADRQHWFRCRKCFCLYHRAGLGGVCPADDRAHAVGGPAPGSPEFWLMDDPDSGVAQRRWMRCRHCHSIFFDGFDTNKGVCPARSPGGHESEGPNLSLRHYPDLDRRQPDWRFCHKCRGLFFDGYQPNASICPAGGTHAALGYNFTLRFDGVDTQTNLSGWHYCGKCRGLFFSEDDPMPNECPAGTTHQVGGGGRFILRHSMPQIPGTQNDWMYCGKCRGLFFNGYQPNTSVCPATSRPHASQWLNFQLPHRIPYDEMRAEWRGCRKCNSLFFNGELAKGRCARGGGHAAAGYEFTLLTRGPDLRADGPGFCAPHLVRCGWLDPADPKVALDVGEPLRLRPGETRCDLPGLTGAPTRGWGGPPVVAFADGLHEQRLMLEYRTPRWNWDAGINDTRSSQIGRLGSIVAHLTGGEDEGRKALKIGAFPAEDQANFFLSQVNLHVTVEGVDEASSRVHLHLRSVPFEPYLGQANWRFCVHCFLLFFDGYPEKGKCRALPDAGEHRAIGLNFVLPHDSPPTETRQGQWNYCAKCHGLVFTGTPLVDKACPAGDKHVPVGFQFVLPHDIEGPGQHEWRACTKCQSLFFHGFDPKNGSCLGGEHNLAGFDFVLPHL